MAFPIWLSYERKMHAGEKVKSGSHFSSIYGAVIRTKDVSQGPHIVMTTLTAIGLKTVTFWTAVVSGAAHHPTSAILEHK